MSEIKELTQEQQDKIPEYIDIWQAIALDTGDCEFEAAVQAAKNAYDEVIDEDGNKQLQQPKYFYLFDSPQSSAIGVMFLKMLHSHIASIDAKAVDLKPEDSGTVVDGLRGEHAIVFHELCKQYAKRVNPQAQPEAVGNVIWSFIGNEYNGMSDDDFDRRLRENHDEQLYGCSDANWLGFYEFLLKECDVERCKYLSGLIALAKVCGWWSAYDETVIFQHKPDFIKRDENKFFHAEDGPAIGYRDGFGFHYWRNIKIPSDWLGEGSVLTPEICLHWENVEQRRCACEIYGWHNILDELNAVTINEHENPIVGKLVEVEIPDIGKERFLDVICGTGRRFALPVPPDIATALDAQAWMNQVPDGIDPIPVIRT